MRLGIGEHIEEYFYQQITNVRLEKGLFSSSLVFHIPGMTEISKQNRKLRGGDGGMRIWGRENEGTIDAIPKKSAEKLYEYCRVKIDEARKAPKTVEIAGASSPPYDDGDPLKILKARYARGEITEEEFERMRAKIE
ncbi:MAG: SHOCT domain-containing protein [Alphaproteobacteria bacterium]|nr:SHOCT domain-containing protein [Alphaproteobacteria bacterium]